MHRAQRRLPAAAARPRSPVPCRRCSSAGSSLITCTGTSQLGAGAGDQRRRLVVADDDQQQWPRRASAPGSRPARRTGSACWPGSSAAAAAGPRGAASAAAASARRCRRRRRSAATSRRRRAPADGTARACWCVGKTTKRGWRPGAARAAVEFLRVQQRHRCLVGDAPVAEVRARRSRCRRRRRRGRSRRSAPSGQGRLRPGIQPTVR